MGHGVSHSEPHTLHVFFGSGGLLESFTCLVWSRGKQRRGAHWPTLHSGHLALHTNHLALHTNHLALQTNHLALHSEPLAFHSGPLAFHSSPLAFHSEPLTPHSANQFVFPLGMGSRGLPEVRAKLFTGSVLVLLWSTGSVLLTGSEGTCEKHLPWVRGVLNPRPLPGLREGKAVALPPTRPWWRLPVSGYWTIKLS